MVTIGPGAAVRVRLRPTVGLNSRRTVAAVAVRPRRGRSRVEVVARPRYDWLDPGAQSPYLIGLFVETKTVWHPIGA